jgi:hypothetical protein
VFAMRTQTRATASALRAVVAWRLAPRLLDQGRPGQRRRHVDECGTVAVSQDTLACRPTCMDELCMMRGRSLFETGTSSRTRAQGALLLLRFDRLGRPAVCLYGDESSASSTAFELRFAGVDRARPGAAGGRLPASQHAVDIHDI